MLIWKATIISPKTCSPWHPEVPKSAPFLQLKRLCVVWNLGNRGMERMVLGKCRQKPEQRGCKVFPMSWICRNRIVACRFSFCAWPLYSLVWIPDETGHPWVSQASFPFTAPTRLLLRHQAAALPKRTHGPTAYFDSWKLESETSLWALIHLNRSDQ